MPDRTYLDWNASAPQRTTARAAALRAFAMTGNASSVHAEGRAARAEIEKARAAVAALAGAEPLDVIFTASGTEANALALSPAVSAGEQGGCTRLLVSAIEHPSVLAGGRFPAEAIERIGVTAEGVVDIADLKRRLAAPGRPLVAVMLANNETGVIQPIREIAALVHEAGGLLLVDAVQAAGRIALDFNALSADLLTLSSHKIGGPQGAAALIVREGVHVDPLLRGGGQERGRRAGTENVAAIAGFGAAAEDINQHLDREAGHMLSLRQQLESDLRAVDPAIAIFGSAVERLPNTTLFAMPGIKAETALIALDLAGAAVSSGSACSSGKVASSHVLAAMGVADDLARGAIRVSTGPATTNADIVRFIEAWRSCAGTLGRGRRDLAA